MARRRKTYVPRPRKPYGSGKVRGRDKTTTLQQNNCQSSERDRSASISRSRQTKENGIEIQPIMSNSEKVALLLREDLVLSCDSDCSSYCEGEDENHGRRGRIQPESPRSDAFPAAATSTSSTSSSSSGDGEKVEFGPGKRVIFKKEWSPLPLYRRNSEVSASNSSSVGGYSSGDSQISQCSAKSSSSSSSSEDEYHDGKTMNLMNALKIPSRSILRKQDFQHQNHDLNKVDAEEPDYHALYLQKTKRNPKVPKGCHPCPQCNKTYVYYSQLRQHLQRHAMWTCDVEGCGFEYHDRSVLVNHLTTEHGRNKDELSIRGQMCPICSKCFGSAKEVQKHRSVHDATGKYPCKHCGKQFFYWQSRKTHQKICNGNNGKIRKAGGAGGEVMPMEVEHQQLQKPVHVQPGSRVKRAYRRKKPFSLKKGWSRTVAPVIKNVEDPTGPKLDDENENALEFKEDDSVDSDTPLDLSMKTGKCPPSAFNKAGGSVKKRGKILLKKTSTEIDTTAPENGDGDNEQEPPDWRQQQEVLQRVLARRDFLQDIDTTNANPVVTQLCITSVEQVRQAYWGGYGYQDLDMLNHHNRVLAEYYYPQQFYGLPGLAAVAVPTSAYGAGMEINWVPGTIQEDSIDIENC